MPVLDGADDIVQAASFFGAYFALRTDGTVLASASSPPPDDLRDVVQIDASTIHGHTAYGLALLGDGTVRVWAGGPQPPAGLRHAKQIAAGSGFCLALDEAGKVHGWGKITVAATADGDSTDFNLTAGKQEPTTEHL
ncbi:RCC1 domain-containing protein [Streptomyces lavendulae]|uniref:hypothetical protein n=1 Tax=Streptomyces lavendulae TaxID=1914 RepID=UPI00382E0E66